MYTYLDAKLKHVRWLQLFMIAVEECMAWVNSMTIDPHSRALRFWGKVVAFVTILVCLSYPYAASFPVDKNFKPTAGQSVFQFPIVRTPYLYVPNASFVQDTFRMTLARCCSCVPTCSTSCFGST